MKNLDVTLKWDGDSGDRKRSFVIADQNDGWKDLRIEVDTDDCSSKDAKAMMQVVMDRCNTLNALRWTKEKPTAANAGQWFIIRSPFRAKVIELRLECGELFACEPCSMGIQQPSYGRSLALECGEFDVEFWGPLPMPSDLRE